MNRGFVVLDKNNNLEKKSTGIVIFKFENKEYLIYSIDENNQNKQILLSKLVSNSEGKNFIDDISVEEKNKLSNIVYNIVIILPTEAKKGKDAKVAIADFSTKSSITLSKDFPELQNQEYHTNSSIAITSSELVDSAINFYEGNLESRIVETNSSAQILNMPEPEDPAVDLPAKQPEPPVQFEPTLTQNVTEVVKPLEAIPPVDMPTFNFSNQKVAEVNQEALLNEKILPNPQADMLATLNSALPNNMQTSQVNQTNQPNLVKQKRAGFARSIYIIIGTVCLVLSVIIVIVAYLLLTNTRQLLF